MLDTEWNHTLTHTQTHLYLVAMGQELCPLGVQLQSLPDSELQEQLIWIFLPDIKHHNLDIINHIPGEPKYHLSSTFLGSNYQRLLLSQTLL